MTTTFIKPILAENRQDSFWYDGQVATVTNGKRTLSIEAIGEVRVYLDENGGLLSHKEAREEALRRELTDTSLDSTISYHDGWVNNNWFAFYDVDAEEWLTDICYEYNNAIETAMEILDEN